MKRKWYWRGGKESFEKIYQAYDSEDGDDHGPWKSFVEAKNDALSYYECDRRMANEALISVRRAKPIRVKRFIVSK